MSQENVEIVRSFSLGPDVDIAPLFRDDERWATAASLIAPLLHQAALTLQARLPRVLGAAADHRVVAHRGERLVGKPLRPGAGLAPPASGHDQPHEPIPIRGELLRACFPLPCALSVARIEEIRCGCELGWERHSAAPIRTLVVPFVGSLCRGSAVPVTSRLPA
jgi:hypothetical protein